MLTHIRLQNFRCFEDHTIPFRPCTIIVGKNNAGKSTLVDALRLVSIVTGRYRSLAYKEPPDWGILPRRDVGIAPSLKGMEFNTQNLFHRYGDAPGIISATFDNGSSTKIYVGPDAEIHAAIFGPDGTIIRKRNLATEGLLPRLDIMPQVGPVQRTETILDPDYVRANLSSSLAPMHFRNQLNIMAERLPHLQRLAEETWHGLQLQELVGLGRPHGTELELMVRNDDYVSELSTMGHGLQMWLQTMWFLARVEDDAAVALDEPDVYMHPDLQRRLIRYLRNNRRQVIVTTHSVEIMAEAAPEDILVIDRQIGQSRFATSLPAAQRILEHLGSAQNLQLARLWHARKCLLVEGKDLRYLSDFFDVLYPHETEGLTAIPSMQIGGWGGWSYAIGSSMLLQNAGGEHIAVYCILDSDYHTVAQKGSRRAQAMKNELRLHIWERKEIENYFLIPSVIQRLIATKVARRMNPPTEEEISKELDRLASLLYDEVFDGVSAEILGEERGLGAAGANKKTRKLVDAMWASYEGRLSLASGKTILAGLFKWSQEEFGVSLTGSAIVRSMYPHEVPEEMQIVITAISEGRPLA